MWILLVPACGGEPSQPAAAPEPAQSAHEGKAVEGDLYAQFDASALEEQADQQATSRGDMSDECRKAATAWEQRARPQIKACYREGKKKNPNLMGTASIVTEIGGDGKPKPAKLDGTSSLGDDVANCMVKAVSKTDFPDAAACRGRQLTIPIEFPTPVKPK